MKFVDGYLEVARVRGVAVRVHWSTPLGAFLLSGFSVQPVVWACFVLLVLVHEAGHAVAVRAVGARARVIEVHGFGGLCHWEGDPGAIPRAVIAWGGVLGQLALLAFVYALLPAPTWSSDPAHAEVWFSLTTWNVRMAALNLIPVRPLDGSEAWRLFPLLARRAVDRVRRWRRLRRKDALERQLAELERVDRAFDEAQAKQPGKVIELLPGKRPKDDLPS